MNLLYVNSRTPKLWPSIFTAILLSEHKGTVCMTKLQNLLGRLSYYLSHMVLTVSSMKAWEKLASSISSALAQFSLATLVFSSKEDPKFAQPFCFHARASAICEYRDWFHLHVCVESHKVLRFVLQTIIWSLPMSNSRYHNFYYGAVHRYNNSMPILFSFLYS